MPPHDPGCLDLKGRPNEMPPAMRFKVTALVVARRVVTFDLAVARNHEAFGGLGLAYVPALHGA
jgi:hypothetical protein